MFNRGYYPNPTFLTKAENIRKGRLIRTIVIVSIVVVLVLIGIFINYGARMQAQYAENYPDLVGFATETTVETTVVETTTETLEVVATEETTEATETTVLAPVIVTETTLETINVEDLSVQVFEEGENFYFRNSYPLQSITHEQRDVLLDVLKQNILDYTTANSNERICVRYVNLDNAESTGVNDLAPIVPAGSYALPITLTYWHRVSQGYSSPDYVFTYDGSTIRGSSSFITANYPAGKMFYYRTLANYAVARNDNYALNILLERCGGIDTVWGFISSISGYINFNNDSTYYNHRGVLTRGSGRTSCYDMAAYARYLYYGYLSDPDIYQPLINDLYYSEVPSPFTTAFGEDATVLHVSGRNESFNAYTDVAIIDAEEPIALIVYCECSSFDRAQTIQADIATFVAQYLDACH
ncbi:MAG: serine hydrolase [Saccharofermentans sp.]|nr:serine hydrolase [Saccharofermentans sp.]